MRGAILEQAKCGLCEAIHERYRLIRRSRHAFCVVNRDFVRNGHIMVLPRRHCTRLEWLRPEEAGEVLAMVGQCSRQVARAYGQDPVVVMNTGEHSSEAHLHFHIVPSKGGCRDLFAAAEQTEFRPQRSEHDQEMMLTQLLSHADEPALQT